MDVGGERETHVLAVGVDDGSDLRETFDVRDVGTAAEARGAIGDRADDTDTPPPDDWRPDCVVSAAALPDGEGIDLLRWVADHAPDVATVLAPRPDEGNERLASEALAAGLSGYCPAGDPLDDAVRDALDRHANRRHSRGEGARLRTLAENLPNGAVALYDRELRYLFVGGTVFDGLELDPDDLEGGRFAEVHSPEFVDQYGPLYRAALDGDREEFEFTYGGRTFRGHTVPIHDRNGDVVAGMALTQDVTDEHERRRRLERRNERLDRFAGIVGHDLRTPLSVVEGSLVLLRDAADRGETDRVDEHAERISCALSRMTGIVDDLLALVRRPETVDAVDEVSLHDAVTDVWAVVGTPESTLSVELDRDVAIRADEGALHRLLENLLSNAVEHGSTGGRTAEQPDDAVGHGGSGLDGGVTVRVEWLDDEHDPGFAVEDDGPGVPPEDRERAFEWGFTTDDGDGDGLGIGLSIVHEVATAHGWTVSLTEGAAGGARFEIRGVEVADRAADADG